MRLWNGSVLLSFPNEGITMERMVPRVLVLLLAALPLTMIAIEGSVAGEFRYHAPGVLKPSQSGQGRHDRFVYAPDLVFPLKLDTGQGAFANSQVYRPGGGQASAGSGGQCDLSNYSMPWTDNFCEQRSWKMPLCPNGKGHQGADIRPPTCESKKWLVVAAETGTIIGRTSSTAITLRGNSGRIYRYLHVHPTSFLVNVGDKVSAGQSLAKVSNFMGGSPNTTIHLHFDIQQVVRVNGVPKMVFVPLYTSLVNAYRKQMGLGAGVGLGGMLVTTPIAKFPTSREPDHPMVRQTADPSSDCLLDRLAHTCLKLHGLISSSSKSGACSAVAASASSGMRGLGNAEQRVPLMTVSIATAFFGRILAAWHHDLSTT